MNDTYEQPLRRLVDGEAATPEATEAMPVTHLLTMEKLPTGWDEKSRVYFSEVVRSLPAGSYEITIRTKASKYTNTRYKYYFGHLLQVILLTCDDKFQVLDGDEFRPVRDTSEIHDALKMKYNPVIIRSPLGVFTVPSSTTSLPDRDFIAKFEQEIQAEFSGPPWNCEFMGRQEYGQFMANKNH